MSRLRQALSKEDGVTLVEMLVAMSVGTLVLGVVTTAAVQFFLATRGGRDQLVASNDLQTTALWLGRDAAEAAAFVPGSGSVYGTLNWSDTSNQYRYSYSAIDGALVREHLVSSVVLSTFEVAHHVAAQGDVTFNVSGDLLTVTITSTSGGVTDSATLHIAMRSR